MTASFDTDRVVNGSGNLVIGGNDDAGGTLRVHGMPALKDNETYQVWLERDGEVIPKAMFTVSDDGDGLTAVDDLQGADRVMVTKEPAGGARCARRAARRDREALARSRAGGARQLPCVANGRRVTATPAGRPVCPARTAGTRSAPTA